MKRRFFSVLMTMFITIISLNGCNTHKEIKDDEQNQAKQEIQLDNGACINEISGGYNILSIKENEYTSINNERFILSYNKNSGSYLYISNKSYYIHYNGSDIELSDKNVQAPLFSPDGKYLFYFSKDQYLQPVIYDLKNSERLELKINSSISGTYATWFGNDKIIYYGVKKDSKTSGMFSYDLKSNQEKLEEEISGGYVSFIKAFKSKIIFFMEKYNGEKSLKSLDYNGNIEVISDNVAEIYDIEMIDDSIYLLGRMTDNVYSLYDLSKDKRLIFDFPSKVMFEKGLSHTDKGEILFIGNNDGSTSEKIYACSDNSIYVINSDSGDYTFIEIN